MIVPLKQILDQYSTGCGYNDWDHAITYGVPADIDNIIKDAAIELSDRAFNVGWNERSKRISYSKKLLDEGHRKEHSYIKQKLEI